MEYVNICDAGNVETDTECIGCEENLEVRVLAHARVDVYVVLVPISGCVEQEAPIPRREDWRNFP